MDGDHVAAGLLADQPLHDQVEMRRRLARPDQHLARPQEGDVGRRRELVPLLRGQALERRDREIECDRHTRHPFPSRYGSGRGQKRVLLCRVDPPLMSIAAA